MIILVFCCCIKIPSYRSMFHFRLFKLQFQKIESVLFTRHEKYSWQKYVYFILYQVRQRIVAKLKFTGKSRTCVSNSSIQKVICICSLTICYAACRLAKVSSHSLNRKWTANFYMICDEDFSPEYLAKNSSKSKIV